MTITTLTSIHYSYSGSLVDNGAAKIDPAKNITNTDPTSLNNTGDRQEALSKLNHLLTQAYDKLSASKLNAVEKYQENTPLTAEKVANNILGFIERRLQLDQAEGATQEQLQSRLDAGLAGFKKGFAEAEEQLKALALFSPEIEKDLAITNKLVLDGIDALQSRLTKGETFNAPASSPALLSKFNVNHIPVGVAFAAQQTQAYKFTDIDYGKAEARDFQFEVTTKEGDKVSIRASASYGASISREGNSLNGSYSESRSFSFEVEGDLNVDELNSINNLLGKVNTLAEQFYAGDFENAFVNAQTLDFDDQQLNQFSLNLSQAQIEVVTQTEKTSIVQLDQNAEKTPDLVLADNSYLSDFIEKLLSALDEASVFNHPEKLLLDVAKNIHFLQINESDKVAGNIERPKNFDDFVERLIDMNAGKNKQV